MGRKVLTKYQFSNLIYEDLNGAARKLITHDAVCTIYNYLFDNLSQNKPVFIKNFGTFSIITRDGHDKWDFATKKVIPIGPYRACVFIMDKKFSNLLQTYRDDLSIDG